MKNKNRKKGNNQKQDACCFILMPNNWPNATEFMCMVLFFVSFIHLFVLFTFYIALFLALLMCNELKPDPNTWLYGVPIKNSNFHSFKWNGKRSISHNSVGRTKVFPNIVLDNSVVQIPTLLNHIVLVLGIVGTLFVH